MYEILFKEKVSTELEFHVTNTLYNKELNNWHLKGYIQSENGKTPFRWHGSGDSFLRREDGCLIIPINNISLVIIEEFED